MPLDVKGDYATIEINATNGVQISNLAVTAVQVQVSDAGNSR